MNSLDNPASKSVPADEVVSSRVITTDESAASQWAILAVLRFFLASIVAVGHCYSLIGPRYDWTIVARELNQGSAVFGFFLISGFSIAASMERDKIDYYHRRFIRIWPLYLGCIAFGLLVSLLFRGGIDFPTGLYMAPTSFAMVVASLLMLQTVVAPPIPIVGPIWSLGPEWWHYMIAPALRKCSTWILLLFISISFTAFLFIHVVPGQGADTLQHGLTFVTLSWLWLTGFVYYRLRRTPWGFVILTFPSVLALSVHHFTGLPLFITIMVMTVCAEIKVVRAARKVFNWLGDLSFPLYLFHVPAIVLLTFYGVSDTRLHVLGILFVSVTALYAIDRPFRPARVNASGVQKPTRTATPNPSTGAGRPA